MGDSEKWEKAAIEDAVASCSVAVAESKTVVGTGVAVKWKENWLVLTAEHVWKVTTSENLNFGPKAAAGLVRNKPGEQKRHTQLSEGKEFDIRKVHFQKHLDLTVIELSERPADTPTLEFFELSGSSAASPAIEAEVCLFGYPTAVSEIVNETVTVFSTASDWSRVENPPDNLPGFNGELHLALGYSLDREYKLGPHGFSGSGIWSSRGTNAELWHPNLQLGGIALSYYPDRQMIKVLRSEKIVDFLVEIYGG